MLVIFLPFHGELKWKHLGVWPLSSQVLLTCLGEIDAIGQILREEAGLLQEHSSFGNCVLIVTQSTGQERYRTLSLRE